MQNSFLDVQDTHTSVELKLEGSRTKLQLMVVFIALRMD